MDPDAVDPDAPGAFRDWLLVPAMCLIVGGVLTAVGPLLPYLRWGDGRTRYTGAYIGWADGTDWSPYLLGGLDVLGGLALCVIAVLAVLIVRRTTPPLEDSARRSLRRLCIAVSVVVVISGLALRSDWSHVRLALDIDPRAAAEQPVGYGLYVTTVGVIVASAASIVLVVGLIAIMREHPSPR